MNTRRFVFACLFLFHLFGVAFAETVPCRFEARWHVQGTDTDGTAIFWSFTTVLVKTDREGNVLATRDVANHHGDCCVRDGRLYVSVGLQETEEKGPYIYIYETESLAFVERILLTDFPDSLDGITFYDGHFYVALGKPKNDPAASNRIFQYTPDFTFVRSFEIPMDTYFGVQAMTFAHGEFWLGLYGRGTKAGTIQTDTEFNIIAEHRTDSSVGVYALPVDEQGRARLMIARDQKIDDTHRTAFERSYVLKDGVLTLE